LGYLAGAANNKKDILLRNAQMWLLA